MEVFLAILALSLAALAASAEGLSPTSGTCGENVTWVLDDNGVLTISGTGAMTDYSTSSTPPWDPRKISISKLVIEEGVTTIGTYAFDGMGNLTEVLLPDGLERVGANAFSSCSSLVELELPDGLTEIGGAAFRNCGSLIEIVIPDSVTTLGNYSFYYCYGLESVTLSTGLTSIPSYGFKFCSQLQEVTIPEGVTSIEAEAFRECTKLTKIHLPSSLTHIERYAFTACYNLTDVYYGGTQEQANAIIIGVANNDLTGVTWHFLSCEGGHDWAEPTFVWSDDHLSVTATRVCRRDETHVQTLEGVVTTTVSRSPTETESGEVTYTAVFEEEITTSEILESIPALGEMDVLVLPADLTAVREEAFMNASCQAVIVPEGCASIGERSFAGCAELIYVRVPAETQIAEDAFEDCLRVIVDIADE